MNFLFCDILVLGDDVKEYFNGWYFKQTTDKHTISFIVGESVTTQDSHAFIQVLDTITNRSYYIRYLKEQFIYSKDPFYLKIGNNYFSKEKLVVDIHDQIELTGELQFENITPIQTNLYSPNIMGPFGYFTMECNHEIVSLHHHVTGTLSINQKKLSFIDGIGYIERDYGTSFPKGYIWMQSNRAVQHDLCSFFFSVAHIPIWRWHFKGLICILYVDGIEYRFSTYYGAKIKITEKQITIHQGKHTLTITIFYHKGSELIAPKKGTMRDKINESLDSKVLVTLTKQKQVLFTDTFLPTTVEMVNFHAM